jgi:hypothetical protein
MKGLPSGAWPESPGYPQMPDVPGIIHGLTTGLGRYASPGIANPMLRAGLGMQFITKDYIAGARGMIALRRDQMQLDLETAAENTRGQLQDYQEVYHLYGPTYDKNGKLTSGREDLFRQHLGEVAAKHGDTTLQNYLATGDIKKAEEYLKWLGDNGNDLDKTLKMLRARDLQNKIEKEEGEKDAHDKALDIYRKPGTGAFDLPTGGPAEPKAIPKADDIPEDFKEPTTTPAESTGTGGKPGTGLESFPEGAGGEGGGGGSSAAAPEQVAPRGQPPIRLAQADTGTMSDAPPPGAQRLAQAAAPPTGGTTAPATVPATAPTTTERAKGITIRSVPSPYAHPGAAAAGFRNTDAIDSWALADVNHLLTIQQYRQIPKEILPYVGMRSQEFAAQMRKIEADPNLKGPAVYDALKGWNPDFAAALKAYVEGRAAPPASAWQNSAYQARVLGLGSKVDDKFNYLTFKNRVSAARALTTGEQGKTVRFIATAYGHGEELMQDLVKRPGIFARAFSKYDLGPAGSLISSADRDAEARIENHLYIFNHELENALAGRGATIPALRHEAETSPVILGDTEYMMDQVRDKMVALRQRQLKIEDGFNATFSADPRAISSYIPDMTRDEAVILDNMRQLKPTEPGSTTTLDGKTYRWRP